MSDRFKELNAIDCTEHVEKKGKFTYLSWAWAWQTLKEHCPDATFEKHIFYNSDAQRQTPFMLDGAGYAYVMVTVTVDGLEATEIMPVLNHQNKPITNPNSFDVNTALQRTLVKAIAFHGLGLYIYAGEDVNPAQEVSKIVARVGQEELFALRREMTATDTKETAFCEWLKIETLDKLPLSSYSKAMEALKAKGSK